MVEVTRGGQTIFVVSPNCSLTWRGLTAFYASVLLFSGSIAVIFTWLGFWPVLPFAGAELAALGAGLVVTRLRCGRRQQISIGSDSIVVVRDGHSEHLRTAWARIRVRSTRAGGDTRLSLAEHGRELEIGQFLTQEERTSLAAQLRHALAPRTAWSTIS